MQVDGRTWDYVLECAWGGIPLRVSGSGKSRTWRLVCCYKGFARGELVANLGKKTLQGTQELEDPAGWVTITGVAVTREEW